MRQLTFLGLMTTLIIGSCGTASAEKTLHFSSGLQRVQLVELYTSQGCSSCPSAERWLNLLTDDDTLWKKIIPLAFHVDYWDYLGWRDLYSNSSYSARQRNYRQQHHISSVYTPGFIVNGKEWKGWFRRNDLPEQTIQASELTASLEQGKLRVSYPSNMNLELNVAILGFGIKSSINAGENSGRNLPHEFVVLNHQLHASNDGKWLIHLPKTEIRESKRLGLAIWVNESGNLQPLQATGGWLPDRYITLL